MDDLEAQIRKLDVDDGDLLVITSPRKLSTQSAKRLSEVLNGIAAASWLKITALVLDDGMDLKIIRKRSLDGGLAIHEVEEG